MTSAPKRRGWFHVAWRAGAVLLLLAGMGQIVIQQYESYGKRAAVHQWIIAKGGSYSVGAGGQTQIDLPADRFSRDEIRQIHEAYPAADISLRGP
jgi:hypothetical protein